MTDTRPQRRPFIIVAPEGRDASVLHGLLTQDGIEARIDTGDLLFEALESGDAAGAIVTDEALTKVGLSAFRAAVERQPTWSDFPFIVLARRTDGARKQFGAIEQAINATILERPLHPASLLSAVRSAMRARSRQFSAARHLSELEQARSDLKQLADLLESKVRERTRDLAAANDRLTAEIAERERAEQRLLQAQKMEVVGQLTGGIAHDFNNLLTAVIGSLDLLLRRTDDERLRRLARNALHAAERGAALTSQMLAFSRRQRLSPKPLDINGIISGMGDLLARSLGPRVTLETRLDPDLWLALADPTQLEMMILNLAINARDAMPSGGKLSISTANVQRFPRELRSELAAGEYVCIAVQDTGTGMSSDVAARAFEPFFTTKEPGKGTGLGLSQLYGFARQSGGTARIESREGEGTTVSIYLPRTTAIPHRPQSRIQQPESSSGARILLVDDDDDVRVAAAAMVEELGYVVTSVADTRNALDLVTSRDFDLLITDVMMPGMNGIELARELHRLDRNLPVLFATGYVDVEELGDELRSAVVIRKPFRMSDLAARIAAALAGESEFAAIIDLDEARRERDGSS